MKAASVQQIKQELAERHPSQLVEVVLRLAKFKKENKELLSYLLFYENDEQGFINDVKSELDILFKEINRSHLYYAKKSLRKILCIINKFARYSPATETEISLRLYFVSSLKNSGIPLRKEKQIFKMHEAQILKIKKAIATLHEDLQYDFERELAGLLQ